MRTILRLFVWAPLAFILLMFSVANRHLVTVSFDPFPGNDIAGPHMTAPLFVMMLLCGGAGVFAGGMTVWMRQGRYRRMVRAAQAEAQEARGQANDMRDRLATLQNTTSGAQSLSGPSRQAAA
jgi:hypothetical protein